MDANEKREREIAYTNLMAETLWNDEFALWQTRPSVQRAGISVGSIFVLWKMTAEQRPDVEDAFIVTDVEVNPRVGLLVHIESKRFMQLRYTIGHKPSLLAGEPEVFVWIPFYTNVSYTPRPSDGRWILRLEMCMRTRSHPSEPIAGHTYFTQVGEFRARFREFAEVKF